MIRIVKLSTLRALREASGEAADLRQREQAMAREVASLRERCEAAEQRANDAEAQRVHDVKAQNAALDKVIEEIAALGTAARAHRGGSGFQGDLAIAILAKSVEADESSGDPERAGHARLLKVLLGLGDKSPTTKEVTT
jgi:hypothetical protein